MSLTRWMRTTAIVLALGLLGGAALLAHRAEADGPAPTGARANPARPAAEEDRGPAGTFRFKFREGRPFYQEVTTTTLQSLEVMGHGVTQRQEQTFTFSWTPVERRPDGGWVLTQKVEALKMNLDIGGNKIEFDSALEGNSKNALADFFKALVGAEFRVTLDREYQVRKVEGRDEFLKKALPANPALGSVWHQVLSADALRRGAEPSFPALPEGPVRPGDSWVRKGEVDLGSLGTYRATHVYTYEGKEGNLDRITVESLFKGRTLPGAGTDRPFVVKSGTLERASGTGTILFDRAEGRVVRLEANLDLEGPVDVSMGKEQVGVVLRYRQRIAVRTPDANPLRRVLSPDEAREEIERLRQENERLRRQLQAVEDALREARPRK